MSLICRDEGETMISFTMRTIWHSEILIRMPVQSVIIVNTESKGEKRDAGHEIHS